MKGPSICYIKTLIYKTWGTMRHFHIYLWLLQYNHNATVVPDGDNVTKVNEKEAEGGAQVI